MKEFKSHKLHDPPETRVFRRKLRNKATSAEAFLWIYLKEKKLAGRKFRRQHGIGPFIVDFFCHSEKLIIELDGQPHLDPLAEEKDEKRTAYLNKKGFRVMRFENKMVFDLLPSVIEDIQDHFLIS
ncbi:MAG: very-short-patch-repair endonuclease [Flavobacteriales bacterium]|jgi:very-short-patch-repair endonuclease